MQKGSIVEPGEVHSVLDHPQQTYTQELLASVPEVDTASLDGQLGD
jgi:ABC-type dipeptide/oligopeptide/nickel transport system ATPase component